MLLYHYSENEYNALKSMNLRALEAKDDEVIDDPNPRAYANHISFLFEKIPLDLAKVTDNAFSFWKSGKQLYEHVVDTSSLPLKLPYYITETPEKTRLLYVTQNWSQAKGNPELVKKFKQQIADMEKKNGYIGESRMDFVSKARKFNHGIKKYYQEAFELALAYPEDDILDKYAACVPHAMLYVANTPIQVRSVKKIELL